MSSIDDGVIQCGASSCWFLDRKCGAGAYVGQKSMALGRGVKPDCSGQDFL